MLQIFALGAVLIGLAMEFLVWLYIAPITLALIGLGFLRDSVRILRSPTLAPAQRATQARHFAGQGVLGLLLSAAVFFLIFYRKELLRCVTGIF